MGCDIHIVLERREDGSAEWVGVYSTDECIGRKPLIARRDYGFFAEVASVRGTSAACRYPRNLPKDVSRLAWLSYIRCPGDHHSVSHLSPREFTDAWFAANEKRRSPSCDAEAPRKDFAELDLLGIGRWPDKCEYRVIFWFDN